ncbi:MAG: hypothetical protein LBV72_13005 [Tannerella sp.]|jgi:hypothetical protein|nr:hypothetical protein [Tannerella sp.]
MESETIPMIYWDKEGQQSIDHKTAFDYELIYDNVPNNALLLLHNHTRGNQEHISTYENGKQVWW